MTGRSEYDLPEIDLSPPERALGQLEIAIEAWAAAPDDTLIRDAVIQRFEFTYELSVKMLLRYLRSVSHSEDAVNELTFREILRKAGGLKLIDGDVLVWLDFRQARTETVHTYNESRAIEVAQAAGIFAVAARSLLTRLTERIAA